MMSKPLFRLGHSRLTTVNKSWQTIGTITTLNATLAVGGRAQSDITAIATANKAVWDPVDSDINAVEFRFQTDADADAHVVEVWAAAGNNDHYTLIATLTLTGGTQEGDSSQYFVDTITTANENLFQDGEVMDSATNRICRYAVDLCGYDRLCLIATTLASSTTLTCEARGW